MYGKIHDCIFGSSIMEEDIVIRYIWMCLITIADKNGIIDETIPALARRFNVSVNEMIKAIEALEKTDISSRTPENNGRRLERIRDSFGWRILNYDYYRDLQSSQHRAEYMKDYMRERRSKQSVNTVLTSVSTLTDTDTDTDKLHLSEKFDRFWKSYPRKEGKGACRKIWFRLKPSEELFEKMVTKVEQQKTSEAWTRDKGRYIPMPATWLNQERWDDETATETTTELGIDWGRLK